MRKIFGVIGLIAISCLGVLLLFHHNEDSRNQYINASTNYTVAFSAYDKYLDTTDSRNSVSDLSFLYKNTYKTYLAFSQSLTSLPLVASASNGLPSRTVAVTYLSSIGKYLSAKENYLNTRKNCYTKKVNKNIIDCLGYARGAMIVDNSETGIFATRKALNLIKIEFNHETNQ